MKSFLKVLTFGAMLAASSSLAYASPLSGTVTIDGGGGAVTPAVLTSSTTILTFAPNLEFTLGGTGSFSGSAITQFPFPPGSGIEFVNFSPTFTIPNAVGNPFSGIVLFTFNVSGTTQTFTVTSVTTAPNGSLYFYGTLAGNPGNAVYVLTPGTDGLGEFSGTLTVTPTPEPSSLILLGTGLAGAAGLMFRKRRTTSE